MNARFLILSILITVLLSFLPFAQFLTYPFFIFSTFIHETSHAIAAVATGGHVDSLTVRMNGSGITYTHGGVRFLISSAGYIGTSLAGGLLLILSRNKSDARKVLYACAILTTLATTAFAGHSNNLVVLAVLALTLVLLLTLRNRTSSSSGLQPWILLLLIVSLVFYLIATGSLFSWMAGLVIAISLFAIARFAQLSFAHFFLTFLAVQCSLNALDAVKTVYFVSLRSSCPNDAATMSSLTGFPAWLWAILWLILSVSILFVSAIVYLRRPEPSDI
jgi:hypothetical protein